MGHPTLVRTVVKAIVGFANRFRPTYAGANVGHPSYSCGEVGILETRPLTTSRIHYTLFRQVLFLAPSQTIWSQLTWPT
jgi:hypothetical protein